VSLQLILSKIREKDEWEKDVEPGGKYYFTRCRPFPLNYLYTVLITCMVTGISLPS
jgi:hypothetical protein